MPNLLARPVNYHALLIGGSGAGTVTNLVAVAADFALSRDKALEIVKSVENQVINTRQEIFYEAGFGDDDIRKIEPIFRALPTGDDL